jgi:hypothetical protein
MRIVALSDQHGFLPAVPLCDLLIVAGDICPDRFGPFTAKVAPDLQARWFDAKVRPWIEAAPATHKIATWGNHDWCGQACDFSRDAPGAAATTTLQILVDQATDVPVSAPVGAVVSPLSVWATPWSNQFMDWAFMKEPAQLTEVYDAIPVGIDILVSHQPPHGHGDQSPDYRSGTSLHLGSRQLLAAIERVRPKLVICGHIHEAYGHYDHGGVPIYNVSVVNEQYRLTHEPTIIDVDWESRRVCGRVEANRNSTTE